MSKLNPITAGYLFVLECISELMIKIGEWGEKHPSLPMTPSEYRWWYHEYLWPDDDDYDYDYDNNMNNDLFPNDYAQTQSDYCDLFEDFGTDQHYPD